MLFTEVTKARSIFYKTVSLFVAATFITSSIAFAAPTEIKSKNTASALEKRETVTDPEKIVILKDTGILKSKFKGKSDKLIIHIQDAHCNYEAQTNIAKIIEGLVKNDGLSLVSVEGADGVVDTSWFKAFPDEEIRKEVATYFMKKGEITGPEFLSITTDLPIKLFGAETREYYIQNLNAFTTSYPLKAETEKYYTQLKGILNRLKGYIYNAGLKELDAKMQDYEDKKIQFNDYIRYLQGACEKYRINIRAYDDFFKLVSVLVYEQKINFNVVDKERSAVIDVLTKNMSKDKITNLVTQSLAFKVGKISSVEFYAYLKALAQQNQIDLAKDYPNLYNYIIYNAVYSRIENEKLFNDIKKVELAIKEKLFQNDDQRTLEKLSRHADILLGLINIKLLNGDYDYYKANKNDFQPEAFADFVKNMSTRYGFSYDLTDPTEAVSKSVPKLEDFYSIAIKRDAALIDNTLKAMNKEKTNIAVLVTGGFHSEGMTKLLEKQGVSYLVICPNITKNEPSPYIQILTNQRTSFEDLLVDTGAAKAGTLAPIGIAQLVPMPDKNIRRAFGSIKGRYGEEVDRLIEGLVGRVDKVREAWGAATVSRWMQKVFAVADKHQLVRDQETVKDAYRIGMTNAIVALKEEAQGGKKLTYAEKNKVKQDIDEIWQAAQLDAAFGAIYQRMERRSLIPSRAVVERNAPALPDELAAQIRNEIIGKFHALGEVTPAKQYDVVKAIFGAKYPYLAALLDGLADLIPEKNPETIVRRLNGLTGLDNNEKKLIRLAFFTAGEGIAGPTRADAYSSPEAFRQYAHQRVYDLIKVVPNIERTMKEYRNFKKAMPLKPFRGYVGLLLNDVQIKFTPEAVTKAIDALQKAFIEKMPAENIVALEKAVIAAVIDGVIQEKYNAKIVAETVTGQDISDLNVAQQNIIDADQLPSLEDLKRDKAAFDRYDNQARELRRSNMRARIDMWAGAASRLFGAGQNVDSSQSFAAHSVYEVAGANKRDMENLKRQGAITDKRLTMAMRFMIQKMLNMERELRYYYEKKGLTVSDESIRKERNRLVRETPRIVLVNDENAESIIKEFLDNNFFGQNSKYVVFVVQPTHKGFDIEDGAVNTVESSRSLPAGHGDATMQILQPGRSFWVDYKGRVHPIAKSAVDYLIAKNPDIKIFIQSRVNDMIKLGASDTEEYTSADVDMVDMGILALALSRMQDPNSIFVGNNIVLEQVGQSADPEKQVKGASPLRVNGKEFLVEQLAQSQKVGSVINRKGAPFNRFYIFFKRDVLNSVIKKQGLPVYFRFRDGYLYPETVTGDVTMLPGTQAGWAIENSRRIFDYKDIKTLDNGITAALRQDKNPAFRELAMQMLSKRLNINLVNKDRAPGLEKKHKDSVGAVRTLGVIGVAREDHGMRLKTDGEESMSPAARNAATLNGVIGTLIYQDQAYSIMQGHDWKDVRKGEHQIPNLTGSMAKDMLGLQGAKVDAFLKSLGSFSGKGKSWKNYRVVVVRGLKDKLPEGLKDIYFHYGETRKQIYIDEDDLKYILSLYKGVELAMAGLKHEIGHLENPGKDEEWTEKHYPTAALRIALLARDLGYSNISIKDFAQSQEHPFSAETKGSLESFIVAEGMNLADLFVFMVDNPNGFKEKFTKIVKGNTASSVGEVFQALDTLFSDASLTASLFRELFRNGAIAGIIPLSAIRHLSSNRLMSFESRFNTAGQLFDHIGMNPILQKDRYVFDSIQDKIARMSLISFFIDFAPQYVPLSMLLTRMSDLDYRVAADEAVEKLKMLGLATDLATAKDTLEYLTSRNYVTLADAITGLFGTADVGAMRAGRTAAGAPKGVTPTEHGVRGEKAMTPEARAKATLNGIIGKRIDNRFVYSIMQGKNWKNIRKDKAGEQWIPVMTDKLVGQLLGLSAGKLDAFLKELNPLSAKGKEWDEYKFVVVRGLKDDLPAGMKDIYFHYGITRNQVYIDEDDLKYILSLYNGVELALSGFRHEIEHIKAGIGKDANEAAIETMSPTTALRIALLARENGLDKIWIGGIGDMGNVFDYEETFRKFRELPEKYGIRTLADILVAMTVASLSDNPIANEFTDNPALKNNQPPYSPDDIKIGRAADLLTDLNPRLEYIGPPYAEVTPRGDLIIAIAKYYIKEDKLRQDIGRLLLATPARYIIPGDTLGYLAFGNYHHDSDLYKIRDIIFKGVDQTKFTSAGSILDNLYKGPFSSISSDQPDAGRTLMEVFVILAPEYVAIRYLKENAYEPAARTAVARLVSLGLADEKENYNNVIAGLAAKKYTTFGEAIEKETALRMSPSDVDAMRVAGVRGVTKAEHGARFSVEGEESMMPEARAKETLNGIIGTQIDKEFAFSIMQGKKWIYTRRGKKGEVQIRPVARAYDLPYLGDSRKVEALLQALGAVEFERYNLVVVTGLKDKLPAGMKDIYFHYGVTRNRVYIDEDDLKYILSLPNGVDLTISGFRHEIGHLENPAWLEPQVEAKYPTPALRKALSMRDAPSMAKHPDLFAGPDEVGAIRTGLAVPVINTPEEFLTALTSAQRELEQLEALAGSAKTLEDVTEIADRMLVLNQTVNGIYASKDKASKEQLKVINTLLVSKSKLARDIAGRLLAFKDGASDYLTALTKNSDAAMDSFLKSQIEKGKTKEVDAKKMLTNTRKYLAEWLDLKNDLPFYMIQGIYRAMLEGRSADILYSFGSGWREFGTAGIRNPALQSSMTAIQEFELDEFAGNKHAPVLTGPNLINAVTLLQQEAAMVSIMRNLQEKIKSGDTAALAKFDTEFIENVKRNRVTIAYDSRINGEYFAKLLAAAFLRDGVDIDLFDKAAGVPHLAWAANREGSAFGILISASHSEANYNGFKAYLGHQMSQVDKTSKDMIVSARDRVGYGNMNLDLVKDGADLERVLASQGTLRWIADREQSGKAYHNRPLVPFYEWYYNLVKERSPLAALDANTRKAVEASKSTNPLDVLYTAFFGAGAVPAADFRGFLNSQGYSAVDIVKAQTEIMDGRFPGHKSPDPGIVQGWTSNLLDYAIQYAGSDMSNIGAAIEALNAKEVAVATDPDIDRAGIMLGVPKGIRGNIKQALIAAITSYIENAPESAVPAAKKEELIANVTKAMQEKMNDKFLLTANDAWTFMMYWKLKLMEDNGKLEKDRVYIIEKSHCTTSALERVAAYYRQKGYKVFVVDTYVGFTEIGKKGRDNFAIAKLSWDAYNRMYDLLASRTPVDIESDERIAGLASLIGELEKANAELKSNVPYQTAGLPIVDQALRGLNAVVSGRSALINTEVLLDNLWAIAHMHILAGVEESNGYGELGRWNPETGKVEFNHISDKDGSLAAYEFLELATYGKYIGKSSYDMYKDLVSVIGMVCTVNSTLYHPGLTGVGEKLAEMEGFEKILAYELQKRLDNGEKIELFNGRYAVTKVEVYRDEKYDNNFLGFTEEGVRMYLTTKSGSEVIATYRPSGTGDSNRDYNWLLGKVPALGTDLEAYRRSIEEEMDVMVRDFFGVEGRETGYIDLSKDQFYGLMIAMKEAGHNDQFSVLSKAIDGNPVAFTTAEEALRKAVSDYALAARKGATDLADITEKRSENRAAWGRYLAAPETVSMKNKLPFTVNGRVVAEIPRAAMIAWQAGLVDYLIGLITREGNTQYTFEFPDEEVTALINKRITPVTDVPERVMVEMPEGHVISSALKALAAPMVSTMASLTGKWAGDQFKDGGKTMLGWMNLATWRQTGNIMSAITGLANEIREEKTQGTTTDIVFIGQGGSVESTRTIYGVLGKDASCPNIHILDTVDPEAITILKNTLPLETTRFVVMSKSVTTMEVHSGYKLFYDLYKTRHIANPERHFTLITDQGKASIENGMLKVAEAVREPFRSEALARGFSDVLYIEPGSGGRYSWDTAIGAFPAYVMMGNAAAGILEGASMIENIAKNPDIEENAAAQYALFKYAMQLEGRNRPTLILPEELRSYGPWAGQLDTESLGKTPEKSSITIDHERLADNMSEYTAGRFFVRVRLGKDDNRFDARVDQLQKSGFPVITITLSNSSAGTVNYKDFGALLKLSEFTTAMTGYLMGVNPVNQPGVESYKKAQEQYIATPYSENPRFVAANKHIKLDYKASIEGSDKITEARLEEILKKLGRTDKNDVAARYAALLYLASKEQGKDYAVMMIFKKLALNPNLEAILNEWRYGIRSALKIDTLGEEAPCILHVKQQAFQEGENRGFFTVVRFAQYRGEDIVIPGSEEKYGTPKKYQDLIKAQAIGALEALSNATTKTQSGATEPVNRLGAMVELTNENPETITAFGDFVKETVSLVEKLTSAAAAPAVPERQLGGPAEGGVPAEGPNAGIPPEELYTTPARYDLVTGGVPDSIKFETDFLTQYTKNTAEWLLRTANGIAITPGELQKGVVISAYDTGMTKAVDGSQGVNTVGVTQAAEDVIVHALGDKMVVNVRGTGQALLDNIERAISEVASKGGTVRAVVTQAGNATMREVGDKLQNVHGNAYVLNVEDTDGRFIPVAALQELALAIGFDRQDRIMACLRSIGLAYAVDGNGNRIDIVDARQLLGMKLIRILPMIRPVDTSDHIRAQAAARAALKSL